MNKFYKLKHLKSVSILSADKTKSFKGGGGTGSGNGYPPPFGEEGTNPPIDPNDPLGGLGGTNGNNGSSNGNNGNGGGS